MSPQVVAAIIAGALTVIGTLAAQIYGRRATSRDTRATLDRTLAEQREQLDKTLEAQSDQLTQPHAEQRTRTQNERFATAAEQIGQERPAVRLAGVYAMAGLADDWEEKRQTCVDVLCAYLRMPYEPPGQDAPVRERLAFGADREARHTVIRVITAHLKDGAAVSWQGLNFDFTGVVFDGGGFDGAKFSGGTVSFRFAKFSGGTVRFIRAEFSGGIVDFDAAEFSGGEVFFDGAEFSGGEVYFGYAKFSGSQVSFGSAEFYGGMVRFDEAEFSRGTVRFDYARFSGGTVRFSAAAEFSGGEVDFNGVANWSVPPTFPWTGTPPPGVKLPEKEDQSRAQRSAD